MILRLLLLFVIPLVLCHTASKSFYIRKDFFNGIKPGEFTIYNPTGDTKHYRIESHYAFGHSIDLISYPSKKLVGKLKAKLTLLLYEAKLAILDTQTERWINGTINANFAILDSKFTIQWNDRRLIMLSDAFSLTTRFYDEQQSNIILAKFTKRFISYFLVNKFDMEIFDNDLPEAIFLLCLAVKDLHNRSGRKN